MEISKTFTKLKNKIKRYSQENKDGFGNFIIVKIEILIAISVLCQKPYSVTHSVFDELNSENDEYKHLPYMTHTHISTLSPN